MGYRDIYKESNEQAVLMNHLFILVTFKAMIFGKVVVMLKMVCQV